MSEFTTSDPGASALLDAFGLEITSSKPVTVTTPERPKPRTPRGTVLVESSRNSKDQINAFGDFEYTIDSRGGKDKLEGGDKSDVLIGGADKDTVIGGEGKDSFVFENGDLVDTNKTKRLDVVEGLARNDTVLLDRKIVDKNLKAGDLLPEDIKVARKNKEKFEETLVFEKKSGVLYYNDDEGTDDTGLIRTTGANVSSNNLEIF